ncbi:MAG: TRAP transporter fused permease subunit [Gammaproteobacteria bacterium]|nr:TRAP transporter fused permease subunit [Gammaproteobacteria bacterium]
MIRLSHIEQGAALALGAFHLCIAGGLLVLSNLDLYIVHLGAMLLLTFLRLPKSAGRWQTVVSIIVASAATAASWYLLLRWRDITGSGGDASMLDYGVATFIILLILVAVKRALGLALTLLAAAFLLYPLLSPWLPGMLHGRGNSVERVISFMTFTTEGVYGIPLGVAATYIITFSIFGAFLNEFGAGDWFLKLARRLTRGVRAAGAKSAILFSALIGMISGSAAGNVAIAGTFTIPMMKREGYAAHEAAAIEAVSSTGGQIMPPIMGAAAFVMAELLGMPYLQIMRAALVPAILYFLFLFVVVQFSAVRRGLQATTAEPDPNEERIASGGRFVLPITTLLVMVFNGYSPIKAAFAAIVVLLVSDIASRRSLNLDQLRRVARAISRGTLATVPITLACAAAGMIAGTISLTGLGPKLALLIVSASHGLPLIALALTMLVAIVIGMGLPTTAVYLVLATVAAPALGQLGIATLPAHLFVFFFGCISTITPPVAISAYVAAGLADADINRTGWTAFAYGSIAFLLPYMFVYNPALLLQGSAIYIIVGVVTAAAGVALLAMAIVGFANTSLTELQRLIAAAAGACLLLHGWWFNLTGAALALLLAALLIARRNRSTA